MAHEVAFDLFSSLRYDPILLNSSTNSALWPTKPTSTPFYMLSYHRDRMLQAAEYFQWSEAVSKLKGEEGLNNLLKKLESSIGSSCQDALRVRALINQNGDIIVESGVVSPVPLENLFPARIPPPQTTMKVSPLTGGSLELGAQDSVKKSNGDPQQRQPYVVMVDTHCTDPTPFTKYKTTSRDMYTGARSRVGIDSMTDPKEVLIVSSVDGEIMEGSLTSVFFWRGGRWITPPVRDGGQAGTTRRWLLEKGYVNAYIFTC